MKQLQENLITILAILGVIVPSAVIWYLLFHDKEIDSLVAGFIGVIVGSYTTVFSYYFGSSSGSKSKQETIDKAMTETSTPNTPTP